MILKRGREVTHSPKKVAEVKELLGKGFYSYHIILVDS